MSFDDGGYGRVSYENGQDDREPRHTQFLDLTDGVGGSRSETTTYFPQDDNATEIVVTSQQPTQPPRVLGGSGFKLDPNTPGRVVESGQEHTGRWTREEHEAFLGALNMYGKEWKKVAAKVKTRTVVQTRTHAQKYFQKLQKAIGDKDGPITHVEMGVAAEAKKANARKKLVKDTLVVVPAIASGTTRQVNSPAAQLLNLSHLSSIPVATTQPANTVNDTYPSHGFSAPSNISELPPPQAFSNPATNTYYSSTTDSWGAGKTTQAMSIVAPDYESSMRRGFPEPSPAASGKRKLAELAAAQMLAGVAAGGTHIIKELQMDGDTTPPPKDPITIPSLRAAGLSLQIVNPETLGVTYNETRKRNRVGEPSPTTPWDGQLEQLVSEEKRKEQMAESMETRSIDSTEHMCHQFPHPICGPGSSYGRSPLHKAICEMDMAAVHQELSDSIGAASLHRKDEAGFHPIHSACALSMVDSGNSSIACEITRLLIAAGGDSSVADNNHNTPLHWASRSGDSDVSQLLLMRNCPPDAQNDDGDTALHWAMRGGRRGMNAVRVLLENGSRPAMLNYSFRRALDVASEGFHDDKNISKVKENSNNNKNKVKNDYRKIQIDLVEEKREARLNFLALSNQSRTLVLHHPECLEHIPKSDSDWEVPDRVKSIMRRICPEDDTTETTGIFPYEVVVSTEFERAKLDFLNRVHSPDYLSFVNDLSKELSRRKKEESENTTDSVKAASVVPFTPMVQKTIMKDVKVKKESHSDTSFSAGSLSAARRAAGAVQHAVDCVLVGRHRNAFCVVRPPGHHAGVKGLLAGGESCGFCIFNNVAAGALHAISDERLMCQRCAIVDIDVHHGNGTEEIVKRCHDPGKLLFFSIHLFDNEKQKNSYNFYPGTGEDDDVAHNIINVPISPLWKDYPPSSRPLVNTHNTRHKTKQRAAENGINNSGNSNVTITDNSSELTMDQRSRTSDTESDTTGTHNGTQKSCQNATKPNAGKASYRRAIQNRLLPSLRAFNPDLILISAGFDAAKGDVGNARHYPGGKEKMGLDLEPDDYAWTTRKILEVADICCQGKVVSVLEGGYGRSPILTPSKGSSTNSLDKALFSECAIRHLHAMIDPYDSELRFGSSSLQC
eukprot:CAMPEP_0194152770 /NCGR_PEP_ID=MMETSP0152-20130528/53887_1 /TAXON_ID=1049557 /ORGANISM="Thalassiothrix antarctica, Strain L6-D1" /LENGTH=1121 /DNA_ID=CAMNT_0038857549 /DNA_START=103 /DNA_END=3468 /DNA_ORIENTATION=-